MLFTALGDGPGRDGPGRDGQKCPINEQFERCGTKCPLTCDNYRDPPQRCDKMCVTGCFCVKPYVRNRSDKCVLPSQCKASGNLRDISEIVPLSNNFTM